MAAPVSQEKKGNQWRVTFIMPSKYTLGMLSHPNDKHVKLTQEPGR